MADGAMEGLCAKCLIVQSVKFTPLLSEHDAGPGEVIRTVGDYDLLDEIARGGMGIIYRARQRSLNRIVAVKTLIPGPQAAPEQIKRFRAEASAAASLQHPNIVAIHEVGVHQAEQYLVMDLVDGPNLAAFIKDQPLSPRSAASYLKTIAEAVQFAHDQGILHRDLKPSNVLIDSQDRPRVTDFGLAKRLEGDSSLTLSGHVLGSPSYMPPEQAGTSPHKVGPASDIYSLGAMLYHMLAGRPPFVGDSLNQTLEQVFNREPVSPRLLNPATPRDLETICLKCLEKEPARRYPAAQALADDLGRFLRKEPIIARPVNRPEKMWRWSVRNPAIAMSIFLAGILGIAGVAGIFWQWHRAEQDLYVANIHRANEALESKYLARSRLFLDKIRDSRIQTSMRGWDWRYLAGRVRGDQEQILDRAETLVFSVATSRNGHYLASLAAGGVKLWDLGTRAEITNWVAHIRSAIPNTGDFPYLVAFTPDSRRLVTGSFDEKVRIWNLPDCRLEAELNTASGRLAISGDGRLLISSGMFSGEFTVWDMTVSLPTLLSKEKSGLRVLTDMAITPDGRDLFLAGPIGQSVRHFDLTDPSRPRGLNPLEDSDGPLGISPDGRWLVSGRSEERPFRLWALPSLQPLAANAVQGSRRAAI
jgi:serine/threonine protein kinase